MKNLSRLEKILIGIVIAWAALLYLTTRCSSCAVKNSFLKVVGRSPDPAELKQWSAWYDDSVKTCDRTQTIKTMEQELKRAKVNV